VYLFQLNSLDDAVRIVKETESIEGAKMVAKYVTNTSHVYMHVHIYNKSNNYYIIIVDVL